MVCPQSREKNHCHRSDGEEQLRSRTIALIFGFVCLCLCLSQLEYTTWEKKGHEHHKRIQALNKEVDSQRKLVDVEPLVCACAFWGVSSRGVSRFSSPAPDSSATSNAGISWRMCAKVDVTPALICVRFRGQVTLLRKTRTRGNHKS